MTDRSDAAGSARRVPTRPRRDAAGSRSRISAHAQSERVPPRPSRRPSTRWRRASAEMEAQYAKNRAGGDVAKIAEQIRRLRRELAGLKRTIYSQPRPLADRPGLPAPAAAPDPRLPRPDLRPVPRAARRPRHRRRQGDRHRPRPPRRHEGHVHRPPEGEEPGRADRLQLRLRPPRGLPQGPR